MSFHPYHNASVAIDDLISTIIAQLVAQGWTIPDPGYDVVRSPDGFDIFMELEATNKRWIQFYAGTWNTGSHTMPDPKLKRGLFYYDSASGIPLAGTELGDLRLSFEDDHFILILDFTGLGANWKNNLIYAGLLTPIDATDEMLTLMDGAFRGSTATPDYDGITTVCTHRVLKDIAGNNTKPIYMQSIVTMSTTGISSGGYRGLSLSYPANKRLLTPFFSCSGGWVTGGEGAGLRGRFQNVCCAYYDDSESNGQTLETDTGETWLYLVTNLTTSFVGFPIRMWVRIA